MDGRRMTSSRARMVFPVWMLLGLVLFVVLLLLPSPLAHAVGYRYAKVSATGSSDCSNWDNACTLQTALSGALSGDEIWVQQGTYTPGANRTDTFTIKAGVSVYGGFVGNEGSRDGRNWTTHVTTLSGEIGAAGNSDNSCRVVSMALTGSHIIDGFTITGGAAASGCPDTSGGGMYIPNVGDVSIQNVIISNNTALDDGGGINHYYADLHLTNVTFANNSATDGGGIFGIGGSTTDVDLTNVTFANNSATNGGGMAINGHNSTDIINLTLTDVTFYDNQATNGSGGGMYNSDCNATLTNVTFSENTATTGGGIYANRGTLAIANTILWGNTPNQIIRSVGPVTLATSVVQGGYGGAAGVITADPLLGTFGSYGGGTSTIPLLPGSSAINAGTGSPTCPTTDQRGYGRVGACDIGAFESRGFMLTIAGGNSQSAPPGTPFAHALQVGVSANGPGEPVNGGKITFTPPGAGASATLSTNPAAVTAGTASVSATANGIAGVYTVPATAAGGNTVNFSLRNGVDLSIYFVKPEATGDCSSWTNACALQSALGLAGAGDEIWVAAGTYTPGASQSDSFWILNGAALYGGFAGTEGSRGGRNWTTNVTTLSGDIGTVGSSIDNSYHVIRATGTGSSTRLDGFTVTGGNAAAQAGGGLLIENGSLTIANSRIRANSGTYGGGIFQSGSGWRLDLTDSVVELNTATGYDGGGMYVGGSVALTNTQVISNTAARHGGGVHAAGEWTTLSGGLFRNNRALGGNGAAVNLDNNLTIANTQFISNTSAGQGGALTQWNTGQQVTITGARLERNTAKTMGGGAYIASPLTISNSTFVSNTVDSGNSTNTYGGGLYAGGSGSILSSTFTGNVVDCNGCGTMWGGGLYTLGSPSIQDSTFSGNTGWTGGGMYSDGGSPTLTNVTFDANIGANGGGMCSRGGAPVFVNVTFRDHHASMGGGLFVRDGSRPTLRNVTFSNNRANGNGGGMYSITNSPATLTNATFVNNSARSDDYGGAIHATDGPVTITNGILWGNTPDQVYTAFVTATIKSSVVQGGCPAGDTCTDIITAEPLVGTLGNYGGATATVPLLPGSSAINAANASDCPATDQRGYSRVGACDIGAFEARGFTLAISGGNYQGTRINASFASPLRVGVSANGTGDPVDGGRITFTPAAGGASAVLATNPATITSGEASVTATANNIIGAYQVVASAAGANTIHFDLTNLLTFPTHLPLLRR